MGKPSISLDGLVQCYAGKRKGLETLIRKKVPSLLDIDGDTCHHAQICAKNFCVSFGGEVEELLKDLHTDFRWSAEMKDKLFDLCHILGIKATSPERYVPHLGNQGYIP